MAGYKTFRELLSNEYSRAREAIFHHKICYDLKIAAVAAGAHLQVHKVEVDEAGVDLIVEWGTGLRKIQVKTCDSESSTASWAINAALLKCTETDEAEHQVAEWQYHHPFGVNGAVILAEIDLKSDPPRIRYLCSDLYLLMLLRDGVVAGTKSDEARRALLDTAKSEYNRREKVKLTRSCFLRATSPIALLELISLPARSPTSWKQMFYTSDHKF